MIFYWLGLCYVGVFRLVNVEAPMRTVANLGIDSYADPGGGEPPPTPTSPVCDSAFSEHAGCWPCEHRDHSHSHSHSESEAFQPSQPSSGRSSPHWDDDEDDRPHHILSQGLGLQLPLTRAPDLRTTFEHTFDRYLFPPRRKV